MVASLTVVVPGGLGQFYRGLGEPFGRVSLDPLTPMGLALVCVSLAAAIPVVLVVSRVAHGLPGRWVTSVAGCVRWRWLLACIGLSVMALGAAVLVASALPEHGGATVEGSLNNVTEHTLDFALIVLLLVPLQAAGEEFAFRGYLTQAVGGLLGGRVGVTLAVIAPAVLFALAHGSQDPPVFLDRLAFGVVAGVLVIVTGGLEAGIAMHVVNNWTFFALSLLYGDITEALAPVAGTWWLLPGTVVQSATYLVLVWWVAHRRGLQTSSTGAILERNRTRV